MSPRSSPPPPGRFAIDAPRGRRQPFCRQCEHPAGILFLLPVHCIRGYRQRLPAPLRGWEEAAERPGGGGDPAREVFSDMSRQGRGEPSSPPPSPASPSPTGAIRHRRTAREEATFLRQCENTQAGSLSCSPCTPPRLNRPSLLAPDDGGGQPQKRSPRWWFGGAKLV